MFQRRVSEPRWKDKVVLGTRSETKRPVTVMRSEEASPKVTAPLAVRLPPMVILPTLPPSAIWNMVKPALSLKKSSPVLAKVIEGEVELKVMESEPMVTVEPMITEVEA